MSEVEPIPVRGRGRCGCDDGSCGCSVVSGGTVAVVGTGDPENPYQFTTAATIAMQVLDTPAVNLTLTGAGTVASPYVLSGEATTSGADTTILLDSATFEVPETATMVLARVIGGGGGGGGGRSAAPSATYRHGGSGGQGGYRSEAAVPVYRLPTLSLDVNIGPGGAGGGGGLSGTGDGANGTAGTATTVHSGSRTLVAASGGAAGLGSGLPPGETGTGLWPGGAGGNGLPPEGDVAPSPDAPATAVSPSGGGAGGGVSGAESTAHAGGSSGDIVVLSATGALNEPYTGGQGGAAGLSGTAGNLYGGGGGGGGGADTGSDAGHGGAGAPGIAMIVTW